jgi:hypothetical protein
VRTLRGIDSVRKCKKEFDMRKDVIHDCEERRDSEKDGEE